MRSKWLSVFMFFPYVVSFTFLALNQVRRDDNYILSNQFQMRSYQQTILIASLAIFIALIIYLTNYGIIRFVLTWIDPKFNEFEQLKFSLLFSETFVILLNLFVLEAITLSKVSLTVLSSFLGLVFFSLFFYKKHLHKKLYYSAVCVREVLYLINFMLLYWRMR